MGALVTAGLPLWAALGAATVALGPLLYRQAVHPVLRRRLQHRFEKVPLRGHLHGAARGEIVRLLGRAEIRDGSFRAHLGQEVLIARYVGMYGTLGGPRSGRIYCESHVVDFDLRLEDREGGLARISGPHLVLLPDPPPLTERLDGKWAGLVMAGDGRSPLAWIYQQEIVRPGDEVEVVGTLDFTPSPSGSSGSDRQPRLAPMLVGTPGRPVYVRPLLPRRTGGK